MTALALCKNFYSEQPLARSVDLPDSRAYKLARRERGYKAVHYVCLFTHNIHIYIKTAGLLLTDEKARSTRFSLAVLSLFLSLSFSLSVGLLLSGFNLSGVSRSVTAPGVN